MRKQQTQRSYNKNVYCVNQFAFIWYVFHDCSFYSFAKIIFAKIWKYIDLNGDVTRWRITVSRDCTSKYTNVTLFAYTKTSILCHITHMHVRRMELYNCCVSSQHNRQQTRSLTGTKDTETDHIFAYTSCIRNGIDFVVS